MQKSLLKKKFWEQIAQIPNHSQIKPNKSSDKDWTRIGPRRRMRPRFILGSEIEFCYARVSGFSPRRYIDQLHTQGFFTQKNNSALQA